MHLQCWTHGQAPNLARAQKHGWLSETCVIAAAALFLCSCTWAIDFDEVSKCALDRTDCNDDASDGCETKLFEDVANCGGCDVVCPNTGGTLAACEAGKCIEYTLVIGEPHGLEEHPRSELHGGKPFNPLLCEDAALVGINPEGGDSSLHGLQIACAALFVGGPLDAPTVTWRRDKASMITIGNGAVSDTQGRTLRCDPGTVVTAAQYVRGAVKVSEAGVEKIYPGIARMSLTCSKLTLGVERELLLSSEGVPSVDFPNTGWPMQVDYADSCPAGEVMLGYGGFAGAVLDAVITQCAAITLEPKL